MNISILAIVYLCAFLVIATIFQKHQRLILWTGGLILFFGILLYVGLGKAQPKGFYEIWGQCFMLICGGALILVAEKQHKLQMQKQNKPQSVTPQFEIEKPIEIEKDKTLEEPKDCQIEEKLGESNNVKAPDTVESTDNEENGMYSQLSDGENGNAPKFVLPPHLNTDVAQKVFSAAIREKLLKWDGHSYYWSDTSALLTYLCGRIYCGDYSAYSSEKRIYTWKKGKKGDFPDKELKAFFGYSNMGTYRNGRIDNGSPNGYQKIDEIFTAAQ